MQRKDFFDTFIVDKEAQEAKRISYHVNESVLQYSSGCCEMFTIKLAFYLLRTQIFNDISERYQYLL